MASRFHLPPMALLSLALAFVPVHGQEALPKQVWSSFREARKSARKNDRLLAVFVAEDESRRRAALGFLQSLEGAKFRSIVEIWLPAPADPEASALLDELGLRSLPALVWLTPNGKKAVRNILGEDCVPVAAAFPRLVETKPVPTAWVQNWAGKGTPLEPFLAFAQARQRDLGAAAREPSKAWLFGLLGGTDWMPHVPPSSGSPPTG